MFSLAQMLDNNKFSMSGLCASHEADGGKDGAGQRGCGLAVSLLPMQPSHVRCCEQGLPWARRELPQLRAQVFPGEAAGEPACAYVCFFPTKKPSFLAHLSGREGVPAFAVWPSHERLVTP